MVWNDGEGYKLEADGVEFPDIGDQVEADDISVAVTEGEIESQIEAVKVADVLVQSAAAKFRADGGFAIPLGETDYQTSSLTSTADAEQPKLNTNDAAW